MVGLRMAMYSLMLRLKPIDGSALQFASSECPANPEVRPCRRHSGSRASQSADPGTKRRDANPPQPGPKGCRPLLYGLIGFYVGAASSLGDRHLGGEGGSAEGGWVKPGQTQAGAIGTGGGMGRQRISRLLRA